MLLREKHAIFPNDFHEKYKPTRCCGRYERRNSDPAIRRVISGTARHWLRSCPRNFRISGANFKFTSSCQMLLADQRLLLDFPYIRILVPGTFSRQMPYSLRYVVPARFVSPWRKKTPFKSEINSRRFFYCCFFTDPNNGRYFGPKYGLISFFPPSWMKPDLDTRNRAPCTYRDRIYCNAIDTFKFRPIIFIETSTIPNATFLTESIPLSQGHWKPLSLSFVHRTSHGQKVDSRANIVD